MFASAAQLLEAGNEGKWVKVTEEEAKNIIASIPGENLIRGTKGQGSLRHYQRDGYIAVHSRALEVETHPNDKAAAAKTA